MAKASFYLIDPISRKQRQAMPFVGKIGSHSSYPSLLHQPHVLYKTSASPLVAGARRARDIFNPVQVSRPSWCSRRVLER